MAQEVKDQVLAPPWLEQAFIQRALCAGDEDPGIKVVSYQITMANAVGDGVCSVMYRVVAKLQDSQERRVVVKCQPQGGTREKVIKRAEMFDKETKMLKETLPAMSKLLEQAKPGVYQPLAAKCLYHGKNSVQFLVLEDLRQSGYTLVKSLEDMDLAHCTLAVKALATFHASSLALFEQDPNAFQNYRNPLYIEYTRKVMTPFFHNTLQSLEKIVMEWPGYEKFSEKMKNIRGNICDHFMESMKAKSGELQTLVHGDVWLKNIMFKYSGTRVTDVKLVDFQVCYYSSPTIDLHHFLSTCPNEEVRDNSIDLLLQEYHSALIETLDVLDCSKYKITLEKLKKEYDDHVLYSFIIATSYLPLMYVDPSSRQNLNDLLNSKMENSWEEPMRSGFYERLMKKLLLKCESLGVL